MGNPVLRKVAEPLSEKDIGTPKFKALIADMIETMFEYDGRGLAAPQIHESLQVVVMLWDFDPGEKPSILVLINPVITPLSEEKSSFWEGCLSVPGLRGKVTRPNKVRVQALGPDKEKIEFVAEGFCATVVQHECDHLQGVLYVDRIETKSDFAFSREFEKYHAKGDESDGEEG
jgi:peptide deformylase